MIKLIASDLDGTLLLNGANRLHRETFRLIETLQRQGRIFVAASGRQYANLQKLFYPVKDQISYICENGALVMHENKPLFQYQLDRAKGQQILKAIMAKDSAEALLSGVNTCYIQPKQEEYAKHMSEVVGNDVTVVADILATKEAYLKIAIYEKDGVAENFEYWKNYFSEDEQVRVVTSGNAWIDVIPRGIDKGSAIGRLGKELGIAPDEMMAVGDNYNDAEMLAYVKHSVAMKSGQAGIREMCKYEVDLVENLLRNIAEGRYD